MKRKTKRFSAFMLAAAMAFALSTSAFAEAATPETVAVQSAEQSDSAATLSVTRQVSDDSYGEVQNDETSASSEAIAKVSGGDTYATLQAAVEAANGSDVILLQDVTESIVVPGSSSSFNLDLNGHTLKAENGKEFTFELNAESGYDYTVTLDGEKLTAVNGKYTIPAAKITGTKLVVMVEKTAHREVEVTEYVKVNNTSIWLVTVTGTVDQTKALQYDGANMFWSEKYNGYAYLVFSADTLETVKAAAKAAITEGSETPTTIAYTGDVNKTGKTDINDAQATWNMYNAEYSAFATASGFPTMEHFLRADMNGDRVLNVKDATAIVDKLG